ncbi:MAG: glycosyltransferase family 4 protein [Rhodoferax sp.]|jgi:UDP-glucose:(heptosyl)LPS alpha-1,3-glucosyltransferase|nr:glycosyltransferase family 4 protein [Rhodoferax sp.]
MKTVEPSDVPGLPARRLRIAVLNRYFSSTGGGAEHYSMALVEQLAARHEIHVFAQQIDHQWPGVTYHQVSQLARRPRWLNQLWYAGVTWWATRSGFDVVHSHENTWHGNVQTVHVLPVKYKLFHDRHGFSLALRWLKVLTSPRLLVYLWLERCRMSLRRRRAIVVTATGLIEPAALAYPACGAAIQVITPGVAQVVGPASEPQRRSARLRLGLPIGGRCVLFVGNDFRRKGLPTLLQALAQLPKEAYLAVAGNASQIPLFKKQAELAGLAQRIHFLGSCKQMDDVYAAADCLAHPTLEDSFAMVVLEALAHGLPVVVSEEKYCGIASLLTDETHALLLSDPTDAKALAQALQRLLDDAALRQRLTRSASQFARQHLWAAVARQQETIYQALCKPSR